MIFSRGLFFICCLILGFITILIFPACESTAQESTAQMDSSPESPKRSIQEAAFLGNLDLMQAHIAAGSDDCLT